MMEHAIQSALSHYGFRAGGVRVEPLASGGGWSGSALWRVTDEASERFCLRRWPSEHPTPQRLRVIHDVLLAVANELPIVATPVRTVAGETYLERGGHLWELTTWRPGAADFHARPSRDRLRAAMRALATFHNLAERLGRGFGPAPAIRDRLETLKALDGKGWEAIEQAVASPLGNELDGRATRLASLISQVLRRTSFIGPLAAVGDLALQPAIRDIHHDHVFFTGDEVTGLIDFGAMRIDTPLTDVARLVGSLVADDQSAREAALDSYGELRPLGDTERRIVDLLDESGLFLGAVNWLTWLYVERREMGPAEPIVQRLDGIIGRLEARCLRSANR